MQDNSCRRYQRVPIKIQASILTNTSIVVCETVDISYSGVFLQGPRYFQERQLIKLQFDLPGAPRPLELLAMVARHVTKEAAAKAGRAPGMGCTFYGNSRDLIQIWEDFVRTHAEASPPQRMVTRAPGVRPVEMPIEVDTLDGLHEMLSDALGMGRLTLAATRQVPVGVQIRLIFQHPTSNERFPINVEVQKHVQHQHRPGMEVALLELDSQTRERLRGFIDSMNPEKQAQPVRAPRPVRLKTSIPILGDQAGVVFTGLVTQEVVLLDDFMDELFDGLSDSAESSFVRESSRVRLDSLQAGERELL